MEPEIKFIPGVSSQVRGETSGEEAGGINHGGRHSPEGFLFRPGQENGREEGEGVQEGESSRWKRPSAFWRTLAACSLAAVVLPICSSCHIFADLS